MSYAVNEVKTEVTAMRTDAAFNALLDYVTDHQQTLDLDPLHVPWRHRQPRHFTGLLLATPQRLYVKTTGQSISV